MEFLTDYYIWFIIIGSIILLITIGYYAEKTGFGKAKLRESKNKTDLNNISVNKSINVNESIREVTTIPESHVNNIQENVDDKGITNIKQDSISNFNANTTSNSSINNVFDSSQLPNQYVESKLSDSSDEDIWKF